MILAWSVQDFDFVKCSLTCYSVYSRGMHSVVELTSIKAARFLGVLDDRLNYVYSVKLALLKLLP